MLCLTFSCNVGQRSSMPQASDAGASVDSLRYARGLTITRHTDFIVVELRDPWNEGRLLHRYLLVPRSAAALPEGMPEGTVVRTPLRRMVVYTSVHCALLNELGASDGIAGVCEAQYVHVEPVLNGLRNGTVADLGEATSPDIEGMIRIGADAILAISERRLWASRKNRSSDHRMCRLYGGRPVRKGRMDPFSRTPDR